MDGIDMDCHTHCYHSHDTNIDPRLMIQAAIEQGFDYIAFTDHSDRDYEYILPQYGTVRQLDVAMHIQEILALQEEYKDRIYVALGMECSYHKLCQTSYSQDIALTDKWDIILNSIHTVGGHDIYFSSYYEGREKRATYTEYLLSVQESLNASYPYDVVAHLGYCARKAIYTDKRMEYKDYADILDSILTTIIDKGVSLELNTHIGMSGAQFLPYGTVVERYIQLGGQEFTFGSDAHMPNRVGDKYSMIADYLKSRGVNYLNIYKRRQAIKIKIS